MKTSIDMFLKDEIVKKADREIAHILTRYPQITTVFLEDSDNFQRIIKEMWCEGYVMGCKDMTIGS